jgi:hypothetical protein
MPQEALLVQGDAQYGILINYTILKFMNVCLSSSDSADWFQKLKILVLKAAYFEIVDSFVLL